MKSAIGVGLTIVFGGCTLALGVTQLNGKATGVNVAEQLAPSRIVQYMRDRFELPDTVKVDAEPIRPSEYPRFYQTVVSVDDGKQKRASTVYISSDARCFVGGAIFVLHGATNAEVVRCVRDATKLPASTEITVGTFADSVFPDILKAPLTVRSGSKAQAGELFVTRDRQLGILGVVLPYRRDFVEHLIDTRNQPSVGPADARVTIVEYADLECPGCAAFHKFLETEFLPKYGNQVRIVFKEYPLTFHTWSTVGAVANQCAYQADPAKYLNYRSLIFGAQDSINAENVRDRLLSLGDKDGLDKVTLAACLDAKASLPRIEASVREAQTLGVNKTPTIFVNGRIIIGVPAAADFYKIVDEAMAASDKSH